MNTPVASAVSALVALKDGKPVTTSRLVAESFGKRHDHVLRDIDNIVASPAYQERRAPNFGETFTSVAMPNGATRQDRMYEMDRQGFEILAMGFTGDEALRWKFTYSDAFAAMEAELKKPALDPLAAQLAELLKDKVLVDYALLVDLANVTQVMRRLFDHAETAITRIEQQINKPLISQKFDLSFAAVSPEEVCIGSRAASPVPARPPLHPMDTFDQMVARVLDTQATVTTGDIARALWGRAPTRAEETRIGRAVGRLGWNRIRVLDQGRRQYHYERTLS